MKLMKYFQRGSLIIAAIALVMAGFSIINAPQVAQAAPASAGPSVMPYQEVQAENANTNGTLIDATNNRTYPGLAVEAIERRAVTLSGAGKFVEFTVPVTSNSIVLRYSIPDTADGAGMDATLGFYIRGVAQPKLAVTSRYGWIYGGYPFNNNPSDSRPHHYYDEVHRLVGQMSPGDKVKVQIDSGDNAPSYTIDLMDFEQVAPAASQPAGSLSLTADFGVDNSGNTDVTTATQNAINSASSQGKVLWVPSGTYRINTQLHVNNVTIKGAGIWYSTFYFPTQTGNNEGFYGNYAPTPSTNVNLSDFAIWGNVVTRIDNDQINGIGGSLTNSTITNLWIEHTKCGMWLDGPFDNLHISNVRIRNQNADGVNFHKGVTNSYVTQSFFRNTGDDALAVWSDSNGTSIADAHDSFTFNRVEIPVLANGIALYGGTDNSITDNYIADQQAEGGGIHVGNRFSPVTPVSGTITIARNTVVRSGSEDYYNGWNFGTGAVWFFALDQNLTATINVTNNQIIDSNYEAFHFIGNSVSNITFDGNQIIGAGTYGIENRANGGSVTFKNTTASGLGKGGYFACTGTQFTLVDGGGNGSWINNPPICVSPYPTPVYSPVATATPFPTNTPCPGGVCPPTSTPLPTATNTKTPIPPTNTPSPTPVTGTVVAAVNAGGAAVAPYSADSGFNQGNQFSDTSTAIDTSGNLDPRVAPQGVYQTCRWNASFTYTKTGLTANATYTVVLHWAELSFQAAGSRLFNVDINGVRKLTAFDVFAAAGFKKAIGKVFSVTADASGQIVIAFSQGGADNPFISGIEILSPNGQVPTNTAVVPTNTSVSPTATRTNTPLGPTATRTNTPVPATNTPIPTGNGNPYGGTAAAIPGTIQSENYNTGGEGVAYHDNDAANNGGQYRTTEAVDVETTTDTGGGYNVGWAAPGEWTKYTVNVTTAGSYNIGFRVASGVATGAFALEVDGVNVTGTMTVPNTGGWQTWNTITKTGVNLTAGQHVLRFVISGDGVNNNWISFTAASSGNGNPYGGTAVSLPGTIQSENYNTGGEGVAYHDLEAANQGGQYRTTEGVDIEASSDTGGGYNLGWTRNTEWIKYTVNVTTAGTRSIDFRVATGAATGSFYLEVDGVNVTGTMTVPNTGGWQTWQTITKTGVNFTAGQHVLRLVWTGDDTNLNWIQVR